MLEEHGPVEFLWYWQVQYLTKLAYVSKYRLAKSQASASNAGVTTAQTCQNLIAHTWPIFD